MKKNRLFTIIALFALATIIKGQGTEAFLRQVAEANPDLKHYESLLEARRIESVTGNRPEALTAGFGYYPGTPDDIGIKRTFEVSQTFDFPTTYILRTKLNRETFSLAETEFASGKLRLLLEARLLAYEYIALKKRISILTAKQKGYDSLRESWQLLLDEQAVTILDYNRLLLELARTRSETATDEAALNSLISRLDYMSGGKAELLINVGYDNLEPESLENIIQARRKLHPDFLAPEKEYLMAVREVDISRAANLPGLELGFGSEIIGGEHYTGPKVGLSVPLWSNRNQLKLSKTRVTAAEKGKDATISLLEAETVSLYRKCQLSEQNFTEMSSEISESGGTELLLEALDLKEITSTEFFSYMDAVYESRLTLVKLEWEYMAARARLLDHLLVSY